ncbi:MAG TPA: FtsQ-type POTRA domain-containing protein [Chthonomonadales bacterium]|nr:FtsQ-type POTRA domain-containing protein [Chthonomonadales bacterium]
MPDRRRPATTDARSPRRPACRPARRPPSRVAVQRAVLWVATALLIASALTAALASPALLVRRVEVAGLAALTPYEVRRTLVAARPVRRTHLSSVRTDHAFPDLERLPWVESVSLHRQLPHTLRLTTRPRQPAATIRAPAGVWTVDASGAPIRPGAAPNVPEIAWQPDGLVPESAAADPIMVAALEVAAWARRTPAVVRPRIGVDSSREICLNVADGLTVLLGQADDLDAKLDALTRVYRADPAIAAKLLRIDLRAVEVPACTPRPTGAGTPANRPATELPRPDGRG